MDSGSTIIALLSKWITGNESFLELYDKKAMHKDFERDRHGKSALGMNTDADHF